jgi:Gpi18-like mannosyltransferase
MLEKLESTKLFNALFKGKMPYVVIALAFLAAKIVATEISVSLANFTYKQWSPVEWYIRVTEVDALTRWDTLRYVEIAQYGYGYEWVDYAFMPLYPALIWLVTFLTGNYKLSAILVSNFFSFAMIIPLVKVLRLYLPNDEVPRATALTLFYPVLFVFTLVGYAESLLLFSVFYSWYYFKKERYLLSSIFLSLAVLTKLTPIIILLTYIVWLFAKRRFKAILAFTPVILAVIATATHLYMLSGEPFIVVTSHSWWNIGLRSPIEGFYRVLIAKRMPTAWWVSRLILYPFLVGFAIWRTWRIKDIPLTLYSIGFYILSTCYARLYDFPRLTLPIIPIYITLGTLLQRDEDAPLVAGCFFAVALYLLYSFATLEYIG